MLSLPLKLVAAKSRVITFLANLSAFTALTAFLLFNLLSCDDNGVEPRDIPLPPLPDDAAIFVSMDGTQAGLWILNANTLELIDSMNTAPGVPWTIEFSPSYSTWYSCWGRTGDYSIYLCNLQPLTIQNRVQLQYAKYALVKSYDEKYLIAYGYKGIDIFDRMSLSLVHQDTSSIFDSYSGIYASQKNNVFYFGLVENREFVGFGIYNIDSLKVIETLRLFNSSDYPSLQDVDFVVSKDEKFLFLSAWNWRNGGGFNTFFVVDILHKKIVGEFSCGPFAQLAVSPDGRSVYISNPGGYLYGFPSHHKMLRYDVPTNSMYKFLDVGGTDRVAVADDNRTIFVSVIYGGGVLKVDALTGKVVRSFSIQPDSLGHVTNSPRNITIGKYTDNSILPKKGGEN